ncbi:hypothetical protein FGB62_124g031 [Gracilaria domingensis]|nr:hypothetical protein FGB62_124g031 [Gracilaria domingensis]
MHGRRRFRQKLGSEERTAQYLNPIFVSDKDVISDSSGAVSRGGSKAGEIQDQQSCSFYPSSISTARRRNTRRRLSEINRSAENEGPMTPVRHYSSDDDQDISGSIEPPSGVLPNVEGRIAVDNSRLRSTSGVQDHHHPNDLYDVHLEGMDTNNCASSPQEVDDTVIIHGNSHVLDLCLSHQAQNPDELRTRAGNLSEVSEHLSI